MAYEATRHTRTRLRAYRPVRRAGYILRYVQEQQAGHGVPVCDGHAGRWQEGLRPGE